ncbi:MAG TPA: metabolite traffic protein EboE [Chitinophagales bacterium]|nr:metabolite traffic protein EboE [Chitinophagales bacterium]
MGKYHLTYCANVYPGESWSEAFIQLKTHLPRVKRAVSPEKKFGVGLYLSDRASREILAESNLREFKAWLDKEGFYVFTMNGFPYGNFHGEVVKENVYQPDWTMPKRVEYTQRLFSILAEILPADVDGGISTCPVSYGQHFSDSQKKKEENIAIACRNFQEIASFLHRLEAMSGKQLHLDIEPEPDCLIENSEDVLEFFSRLTDSGNETIIRRHIRLCYDTCHFSVEYEAPETVFTKLAAHDIRIGKIQLSAAMRADLRIGGTSFKELEKFDEPRYLHQTVKRTATGELKKFRDLSFALAENMDAATELRTHFHVPLFLNSYGSLQSTQDDVVKVLKFLQKNHVTNHLEVETYTWDVLPPDLKNDLTASIVRELEWVKKNLEG